MLTSSTTTAETSTDPGHHPPPPQPAIPLASAKPTLHAEGSHDRLLVCRHNKLLSTDAIPPLLGQSINVAVQFQQQLESPAPVMR